ncbi:MAG TPA: tRNA pseudouridine(38-40) synthase TruA [Candidatus Limnocylindrales bacterium]|nr:tRNA pseudouridine(38-40) synthase TruA [Candidatus Limnocylindrales bacterium]
MRYRARAEYDGTDFAGFQAQPGRRTVQGELERALAQVSGGNPVRVEAAGRTDAGVHAAGQVIAFTYAGGLGPDDLGQALAGLLPADIAVGQLRRVPAGYRPRYQARSREYRYRIWTGPPSPLRERYALGVRERLDTAAMQAAAERLVGRHDFSAFGGAERQPIRTLDRVRIRRSGRMVTIEVVGDSFLRHMVRRLVAALLRVGRGQASVEDVSAALRSRRPAFSGEAAPAAGLVLWRVGLAGPSRRLEARANDEHEDI